MISISWAEVAAIISAVSIITGCAATYVRLASRDALAVFGHRNELGAEGY